MSHCIKEDQNMPRNKRTSEEIVAKLRQVDVFVSQGSPVAGAVRQFGVAEVTYYRWRHDIRRAEAGSGQAAEGVGA